MLLGPSPLAGIGPGVSGSMILGISVCTSTVNTVSFGAAGPLLLLSPACPASSVAVAAVGCSVISKDSIVGSTKIWPCGLSDSAKAIQFK